MTVAPSPRFVKGLKANLAYWLEFVDQFPDQIKIEHPNLLLAIQFGLTLPETQMIAARLTLKSLITIENLGQWQTWFPVLERILTDHLSHELSLRTKVLNWIGRWLRLNRQLDKALSVHQEAEMIAKQLDDKQALAEVNLYLSEDYLCSHQYKLAEKYGKLALGEFDSFDGNERFQAATLNTLGLIAFERGDLVSAEINLRHAANMWQSLDRPTQLARTLKNLGFTMQRQKRLDEALLCYLEALDYLAKTVSELDKVEVQNNIGILYFEWQQYDKAEIIFRQAKAAIGQLSGSYQISGSLSQNLGSVLLKQKRFTEAENHLRRSMILWQQLDNNLELANTLGSLGEAMAGQGQVDMARSFYDEALKLLVNYPNNAWAKKLRTEFVTNREALDAEDNATIQVKKRGSQ